MGFSSHLLKYTFIYFWIIQSTIVSTLIFYDNHYFIPFVLNQRVYNRIEYRAKKIIRGNIFSSESFVY